MVSSRAFTQKQHLFLSPSAKGLDPLVASDVLSPFPIPWRLFLFSCGSPFGGISGLSQFGAAGPLLAITMRVAISDLMYISPRTTKKKAMKRLREANAVTWGSVAPTFANVMVSGGLQVTLIFTIPPNYFLHT